MNTYPVRIAARSDQPGRWLWLVKWLLLIPHYVVLAVLWLAFAVLTLVAYLAVLFTGRYPAGIFAFNVGVLRWTWRVGYYGYWVLGTDRYPPFTLADVPDYPARLEVDHPASLSRGLVLVKWWLLALPHYLIVAVFAGGWGIGLHFPVGGGGLVALLAIIAMVVVAAKGRYPGGLFDLIMGMNRWCFRVLVYAALMRDEYPPFRLDVGGPDPASSPSPAPVAGDGPTSLAA